MKVQLGIDQISDFAKKWQHLRLGMMTNDAALNSQFLPARQAVLAAGLDVRLLFSPEHGLAANGTDGAPMPHSIDPLTGLRVMSCYTSEQKIDPSPLADLDAVLFDLPDIGSRFYTYIWSLSQWIEVLASTGKRLVVLDRPNPISGDLQLCEGPMLDEGRFSSFVGRWQLPVRHGLTVGELAVFWQKTRFPHLDLQVVGTKNWLREQYFQDWGTSFVPTSPAIATSETLLTYPALCFLEGTNWSEGRGTAFPFRICGSPWADAVRLEKAFNHLKLPGVVARGIHFRPTDGKFSGKNCAGIMLHVTDRRQFRPVRTGMLLVCLLKNLWEGEFQWTSYPTAANPSGERHFDLLAGTDAVRLAIERGMPNFLQEIDTLLEVSDWREQVCEFCF